METSWALEQKLSASDGEADDDFGRTISCSGDLILIGAPADAGSAGSDTGSAYVFQWENGTWIQKYKIYPHEPFEYGGFGAITALVADYAIVGTPYDDDLGQEAGAVFTRRRPGFEKHPPTVKVSP